jgi:hypothetical protein
MVACGETRAPDRTPPARRPAEVEAPTAPAADAGAPDADAPDGGTAVAAAATPTDAGAEPTTVEADASAGDDADGGPPVYAEVTGDPARFPLHAIATSFETRILPAPRDVGDRIGYLRNGARMRVGPPQRGGGCGGTWHELPTGGFACTSDGLQVSERPISRPSAPPPPCLDCPLPYQYVFTRLANTPMLAKLPGDDETRVIDELIAARERPPAPAPAPAPRVAPIAIADGGAVPAAPSADGGAPAEVVRAAGSEAAETDATEAPPAAAETRRAPSVISWLERGFFVSLNRVIGAKNRRLYFKTVEGRYVPENRAFRFSGFTPWHGERLNGDASRLPIYLVRSIGAKMVPAPDSHGLEETRVDRLTKLEVVATEGRYYRLASGYRIEKGYVSKLAVVPPPADLAPGEKWIDVDLSEQTLVAYEGDRPILATMVSTGKEDFDTPTGTFRIKSKHIATTMDGNTASDGPYSIEDVPWTMYFFRSYALHGAFWHRQYGIARSHGCVNLSPIDAQFLFGWTLPALPPGWHGVTARRDNPGTRVIVRD